MKYVFIASIISFLLISSCSIITATIYIPCPAKPMKDIVANIVTTLNEQGFIPTLINQEAGIIVTDWRNVSSAGERALGVALSGIPIDRRMRLSVNIKSKEIVIKPELQASGKYGWGNTSIGNREEEFLRKLADNINMGLGNTAPVRYEETSAPIEF